MILRRGRADKEAEAEVAGKTQSDRAAHRLRETQLKESSKRVRLRRTAFVAEAVEVQWAQCAAGVVRYCCRELFGLSGMVISMRPALNAGTR
ncbi:MAG: hypothetical protein HY017_09185 [Betaproteobacteria bacterium]|nr:hypothetical protein [Betaproteobacteria bacterium]